MDVNKAKIQYDESLDKLKLRIVVRVNLQNNNLRRTIYKSQIFKHKNRPVQNDSKAED